MDEDNMNDKLQEFINNLPSNFSILEEQIDIELQMEYFEYSKKLKTANEADRILQEKDRLFSNETNLEEKKSLLVQLASIDNVDAFRTIEKYTKTPDESLIKWSILALQESRMIIESSLLNENQVFISTGLGGKGTKLRYFIVLISKNEREFDDTQKRVVRSEFEYAIKKQDGELEQVNFTEKFCTMLALLPIKATLKEIFKTAVDECNQFGNFLLANFIITNVKTLSLDEIKDFINKADKRPEMQ